MSDFHLLTISEVRKETPNSVCITFNVPDELKDKFIFTAGQYITLKHIHNGSEIRRAYSICSSPGSEKLSVGIKKVKNGTFSDYANSELHEGDALEVMPPEGNFKLVTNPDHAKNYMAVAAGSGITPILSLITAALEDDIEQLKVTYPDRFFAEYLFSRRNEDFGLTGRIDRSTMNYLLKNRFEGTEYDAYYLCGPEEMIDVISGLLQEKGVSEDNIHFELFTSSTEGNLQEAHDGVTKVSITLDDEIETFNMSQDISVLEACLDQGLDPPYSCQGGICSTCIARLTEGKAEMRKNQILTDEEIADGLILTCQAHPSTPTLSIDYDDV